MMGPLMSDCHDPDKPTSNTNGLYGGRVIDQCASYTIEPSYREALYCVSSLHFEDGVREQYKTFKRDDALEAIEEFCSSNLVADPTAVRKGIGGFSQHGQPEGFAEGGSRGVSMYVEFRDRDKCANDTPENERVEIKDPECTRILKEQLLDRCDTNTRQAKLGGYFNTWVSGFFHGKLDNGR